MLWCNAPFERLTGFDLMELEGRSIEHLYTESEDFRMAGDCLLGNTPVSGDHSYPMNYLCKDGVVIETETTGWTLQTHDGTLIGHAKIIRDKSDENRITRCKEKLFRLALDQKLTSAEKNDAVLSLACEFLGMPVGLVGIARDDTMTVLQAKSTLAQVPSGTRFSLKDSDCLTTLMGDVPVDINSMDTPRTHPLLPHVGQRCYIGVPLIVAEERIGTLSFVNPLPRGRFTTAERALTETMASFVAQNVAQDRRMQALQRAATQDWLTGAGSNRQFHHDLETVFNTVRRNDATASLILFDIDHFKSINDDYGHDMGDRVLADIARQTQAVIGPNRKLFRVGGEEFAVILPGSCAESAGIMAEQMRQKLADPPDRGKGLPCLTASFGVAELDPDLSTREAWLKCADIALYASKNNGRNQVTSNRTMSPIAPAEADLPNTHLETDAHRLAQKLAI